MRILISGSLAYDRILNFEGRFAEHILPEKIHALNISFFAPDMRESFGGTAGNMAYTLALLGETPIILANAGKDFSEYSEWLTHNTIQKDSIAYDTGVKTAVATILTDSSNNQLAAFYPGAMAKPYAKEVTDGDFAIVSAGNPDDMRKMPEVFRARKIPFIFDPAQGIPILSAQDLKDGIEGAEVLISNDYELSLIKEKTGFNETEMLEHTKVLVTTFGEKGSRIQTKDEVIEIPAATPENTSDPTGAGDAYRAGFIAAYTKGLPLKTAGQLGTLTACYTIERHGTQTHHFTLEELEARYQETFNEPLPF
jgi:adenosine kinase